MVFKLITVLKGYRPSQSITGLQFVRRDSAWRFFVYVILEHPLSTSLKFWIIVAFLQASKKFFFIKTNPNLRTKQKQFRILEQHDLRNWPQEKTRNIIHFFSFFIESLRLSPKCMLPCKAVQCTMFICSSWPMLLVCLLPHAGPVGQCDFTACTN